MLDSSILENAWVEPNTDGDGWGYKLKPGAPDDIKSAFIEFLESMAWERSQQGLTETPDTEWLYRQLSEFADNKQ